MLLLAAQAVDFLLVVGRAWLRQHGNDLHNEPLVKVSQAWWCMVLSMLQRRDGELGRKEKITKTIAATTSASCIILYNSLVAGVGPLTTPQGS